MNTPHALLKNSKPRLIHSSGWRRTIWPRSAEMEELQRRPKIPKERQRLLTRLNRGRTTQSSIDRRNPIAAPLMFQTRGLVSGKIQHQRWLQHNLRKNG